MTNFKTWIKAAGIRAIKTVAQTAVAMIGTSVVVSEVDWVMVASASVLSGVLSLLTSVAGLLRPFLLLFAFQLGQSGNTCQ